MEITKKILNGNPD